jgi:hypothetical protein
MMFPDGRLKSCHFVFHGPNVRGINDRLLGSTGNGIHV